MEKEHVNLDRVMIPRGNIRRDVPSRNCPICTSALVRIKADARRILSPTCRLVEYLVIPKAGSAADLCLSLTRCANRQISRHVSAVCYH